MKKLGLLVSLLTFSSFAYSATLSIHIYSDKTFSDIIIAPLTGTYTLECDGKRMDSCSTTSIYEITVVDDSLLQVKSLDHIIGKYNHLRFRGYGTKNQFFSKPSTESVKRLYDDDLTLTAEHGNLKLINIVDLEHYVAGVVYCEAGPKKPAEFYKVQAIICRTYALNDIARHISDGFELCDMVHCQVYQGVTHNTDILQAVESTKGMVLVDDNNQLITAAFHANCGGQTLNSEDVWNSALYYLRGKQDTFCTHQPAATWEKKIPATDWKNYLDKKEKYLHIDNLHSQGYWDSIPDSKRVFLYDKGYLIPLKDIRTDWNLHSTYFTITDNGDSFTLSGRGYGHRIGLCQEGAIHMSQLGYNYQQILHFYYLDVQLIDYTLLPFSGFN
jgi:stage II sporulation protein D